jgi:hypothetical protein
MTAGEKSAPRTARPRTLQEDLLEDLRSTAPVAAAPRRQGRPASSRRAPTTVDPSPAVELQLIPTQWTSPRLRSVPGGSGVLLSAGPIRLSLSLPGR